jgi:hypothetical protein
MNSFYSDHVLARSIANEKLHRRESITLETFRNPLNQLNALINSAVSFVKEKLQEPSLLPVYCFEYAPDC